MADPRQLSTSQLEEMLRAQTPGIVTRTVGIEDTPEQPASKSVAITLAMRSLQDRVKMLEDRNEQLQLDLDSKSSLLSQLQTDSQVTLLAHQKLLQQTQVSSEDIKSLRLENSRNLDQLQICADHRKVLESEIERNAQHFTLDRENWELETAHMKQLLTERVESERNLIEMLKAMSQAKTALETELEKVKKTMEDSRKKDEKAKFALENGLEKSENELSELRKRQNHAIKDLEKENKALAETCKSQKETISRLRHELAQVSKNKPASQSQSGKNRRVKPPRRQSFSTTEIQVEEAPEGSESSSRREMPLSEKELEEALSFCNSRYKDLLHRSQEPGSDVPTLRREMNALATDMESKSQLLYSLKQQKLKRVI